MFKNSTEKLLLLGMIFSSSIGCDQTTKRLVEQTLTPMETHSYFFDTIRIQFIKNAGAFLGFGAGFSPSVKFWLFIVLPIVLLSVAFCYVAASQKIDFLHKSLIAMMISGGIGNLIDRLVLDGLVTDFINMGIGDLRTGIFNIADVTIMIGAIGLAVVELVTVFRNRRVV